MDGRNLIIAFVLAHTANAAVVAQSIDRPASVRNSGILVLADGVVLTGPFTPRPDGYDVQVPGGRKFVGAEQVRFIARDLPDAYQRMRDSYSELTPEIHVELARWCLLNKLHDQARREALDALHRDPNRIDARRILESLTPSEPAAAGKRPMNSGLTEYPSIRKMAGSQDEVRSLAGLSRSVAQEFTRHVQPLLMNKCGNAGCHGGANAGEFRLSSAHRGTNPLIAEKNLAAVLKQVNLTDPASSPLLAALSGNHGNLSTPIFRARSGAQQIIVLREWVSAAANDIAPEANQTLSPAKRTIQQVSATKQQTSPTRQNSTEQDSIPHGRKLTTDDTDQTFLNEAARSKSSDVFDPDAFNRRFHGTTRSGRSAAAPSEKPVTDDPDTSNEVSAEESGS